MPEGGIGARDANRPPAGDRQRDTSQNAQSVIHLDNANSSCRFKSTDRILTAVVARSVLFSFLFSVAGLAAPAIGIVTASGHFNVEGSQVWGNATLFDGTMIETSSASSELALGNGV